MTAVGDHVATIANVRIAGPGRDLVPGDQPVDVILHGSVIADIAPSGVVPRRGAVLDADGGWLVPGLWDHHVHVTQWSLATSRVSVEAARSAAEAARLIADTPSGLDGRRVGIRFRDALWPDRPTLAVLDAATGDVPTYLLNADVHSVWLNTAALRREGFEPDDAGMLREAPAFEIGRRIDELPPATLDAAVRRMARDAAARGVVGVVDLDMAWNESSWARRLAGGFDELRAEFGIYPEHLDRALADGLRTGDRVRGAASDLVRVGPVKVITDGSLGTRTAACSHPYPGDPSNFGVLNVAAADLLALMTDATAGGLACAIHAIGDVANSNALDAYAATEAWGTIEHAQLVAHADIPRFARLGVGASVQPEHALDDRDVIETAWAGQTAQPYPLRAFADAGANLLFGSDAPVAALDPWAGMAAAVFRTNDDRSPWQRHEVVDVATALRASTHGGSTNPAMIAPGALADLVVCEIDPLTADAAHLRAMGVHATMIGGRLTHHSS